MRTIGLFATALLASSAFAAPAFAGDFDITTEAFAAGVSADADFPNADKQDNEISGVFGGVRLGVEYSFGENSDGLFVGANYYATLGDGLTSEPARNGNYLIHYTEMEGFSGYELTTGWDFGPVAFGVGWGEIERDVVTYQSCGEDYQSVIAGYCGGGGNPAVGNAREGLRGGSPGENTAESLRLFARYDVNDRFAILGSWQQAEFGQSAASLDVIDNAANNAAGNRTAHGATSLAQDFQILSAAIQLRF